MKILKTAALFSSLALLCGGFIQAQSVDEVINKHIKARGGLKKWNKIKTMKITGTYTGFSVPQPFTLIKAKPSSYYFDHHLGNKKVDVGYNGKVIWKKDLWSESNYAHPMNQAQKSTWLQLADFATPLFNYKAKGHKVKLVGKEQVDGVECYKIELERKGGGKEEWFLNAETYLEFSSKTPAEDFGGRSLQTTFYDDFRKVKGVKVPFAVESEFSIRHRVFEVANVEFNVPVDKKVFEKPVSDEMQKLAFMEGNWDVSIEVMSRRDGKFHQYDKLTTKITSDLDGEIMEEKVLRSKARTAHWVMLKYYYDVAAKTYALNQLDTRTFSTEILHGKMEGNKIVFAKKTDDKKPAGSRLAFVMKDAKSFELHSEVLRGEKWMVTAKLIYTKK